MENLSNDHKDCPNQHENSHKQCDEMGHPAVNMMESQWKTKQQHRQNFPIKGKPLQKKYQRQNNKINQKDQDCQYHSLGSKKES